MRRISLIRNEYGSPDDTFLGSEYYDDLGIALEYDGGIVEEILFYEPELNSKQVIYPNSIRSG